MAHVYTVPPIPGVEDLYSLLTFLTDPDKYKEQLDKLETLRDEVNGLIEKVGKAEEIEILASRAATDRHLAGEQLAGAKIEAGAVIAAARDNAYAITQASEKEAARRDASAKADAAALAEQRAALAVESKGVADMKAEATAARTDAERVMAAGKSLKDEYDGKVARIKAAGL